MGGGEVLNEDCMLIHESWVKKTTFPPHKGIPFPISCAHTHWIYPQNCEIPIPICALQPVAAERHL